MVSNRFCKSTITTGTGDSILRTRQVKTLRHAMLGMHYTFLAMGKCCMVPVISFIKLCPWTVLSRPGAYSVQFSWYNVQFDGMLYTYRLHALNYNSYCSHGGFFVCLFEELICDLFKHVCERNCRDQKYSDIDNDSNLSESFKYKWLHICKSLYWLVGVLCFTYMLCLAITGNVSSIPYL